MGRGSIVTQNRQGSLIQGFHHTGIVVKDLDKMVRFYTQDLGLRILRRIDSLAPPEGDHTGVPGAHRQLVFVGFEGDHQIELVHYVCPPATEGYLDKHQLGAGHICFDVEDLRQTCSELRTRGVRFVTEPKFRSYEGRELGIVYAQDPEGNWLEFVQGLHSEASA